MTQKPLFDACKPSKKKQWIEYAVYVPFALFALWGSDAFALAAFPGAEGAGSTTVGGRGGVVYEVTNLNDSGPGSLRFAVEAEGPRIVVFRVSGTICLANALAVRNPFITVAGQTAPGDGICLRDYPFLVETSDVVVRYLRFRLGDESNQEADSVSISRGRRIVFDHCSASWSVDETFSASTNENTLKDVTVQWCFITDSLYESIHGKGTHGYGSLLRSNRGAVFSFHHNLYAHHGGRSPRPGNYDEWDHIRDPEGFLLDFRNNVIYDFKGGHAGYNGDHESITKINYVGNYLRRGVNSDSDSVAYKEQSIYNRGHFSNNAMDGSIPSDPYSLVRFPDEYTTDIRTAYRQTPSFSVPRVLTDSPFDAYERVLAEGGASFPTRDPIDLDVVEDVRNRTGTLINTQSEVGGWPALASIPAPTDTDHDGIPNDWERERGLNPEDQEDGALDRNHDGYTNVEEYLNYLVRPSVSWVSSATSVVEGGSIELVVERTGYTTAPLIVYFEVAGDPISGTDYEPFAAYFAAIPTLQMRKEVTLRLLTDNLTEGPESLTLRILENGDLYKIEPFPEIVVTIRDAPASDHPVSGWKAR